MLLSKVDPKNQARIRNIVNGDDNFDFMDGALIMRLVSARLNAREPKSTKRVEKIISQIGFQSHVTLGKVAESISQADLDWLKSTPIGQ